MSDLSKFPFGKSIPSTFEEWASLALHIIIEHSYPAEIPINYERDVSTTLFYTIFTKIC